MMDAACAERAVHGTELCAGNSPNAPRTEKIPDATAGQHAIAGLVSRGKAASIVPRLLRTRPNPSIDRHRSKDPAAIDYRWPPWNSGRPPWADAPVLAHSLDRDRTGRAETRIRIRQRERPGSGRAPKRSSRRWPLTAWLIARAASWRTFLRLPYWPPLAAQATTPAKNLPAR